jgi:hypothetical protein
MLEQEMKILKNQIQSTLLDLQEQVLIHYYPTLRAEDSEPPAEALRSAARPNHRTPHNGTGKHPGGENGEMPLVIKEVMLDDIRRQRNAEKISDDFPGRNLPSTTNKAGEVSDWDQFSLLATWVERSVGRIGLNHTRKLIEMNVTENIYGSDIKGTLLSLLSLHEETDAPERGGMKEMAELLHELKQLLNGRANQPDIKQEL